MSTTSCASFLDIYANDGTTVIRRWQNRWPGQTISGYTYFPFVSSGVLSSRSGGGAEIGLGFPIGASVVELVEDGLRDAYYLQLSLKRFQVPANLGPPAVSEVIASFLGQMIGAVIDQTEVKVSVGSTLDPVEASAPPRKFTSVLVGRPPKL